MFWKKRPTVDRDDEEWQLACWRWLDEQLGRADVEPRRDLILPSRTWFPDTTATGHSKARHYFDLAKTYAGMQDWPCELVAQGAAPEVALGLAVAPPPRTPAGTFQIQGSAVEGFAPVRITYDPKLLDDPIQLVATLIHELAHYLLAVCREPPPGGEDASEFATDLATVHLGFGLFGANAAFNFRQFTDFDRQGWSYARSGYLSEAEWAFANALFFELMEISESAYRDYAKSSIATLIRKNRDYLRVNPHIVSGLR